MPTDSGEVDAIARAAAEFENAASDLHKERATLVRAEEDLAERSEAVERQRLEYAEQETALEEAERAQAALDEEFRSLEEALQTDVQRVLEQIRQTERDLKAAQDAYQGHDGRARQEHDKVTAADRDLLNERQSLADAIGQLFDQASAFGEFARPDLRPLLGVSTARAWPDPAAWPDAGRASEDLADVLAAEAASGRSRRSGRGRPSRPGRAVRAVLPAAATEILDAFAAATRGGRQVTEGALKNTADRMSVALKDFTDALAACEEDYRVDWEPGGAGLVIVNVIDDEGRKPVASFATRIDERAKDQGVLLEDRERKVLEDELLAALAGQIHARVVAARDLTRNMNSDTRSKPMSSGISIGIRWAQSDRITDAQRKASHLLDRDTPGPERLAELRGVLRDMIREYRAGHPRATYREALGSVLDYRSWHAFELHADHAGRRRTATDPGEALRHVRRGEVRRHSPAALRRRQRAVLKRQAALPAAHRPRRGLRRHRRALQARPIRIGGQVRPGPVHDRPRPLGHHRHGPDDRSLRPLPRQGNPHHLRPPHPLGWRAAHRRHGGIPGQRGPHHATPGLPPHQAHTPRAQEQPSTPGPGPRPGPRTRKTKTQARRPDLGSLR